MPLEQFYAKFQQALFLGRHSLMAGLRILIQFFGRHQSHFFKSLVPVFFIFSKTGFLLLSIPQNGLFTKKKTKVTAVSQDHQLSSNCHYVSKRREKISQKKITNQIFSFHVYHHYIWLVNALMVKVRTSKFARWRGTKDNSEMDGFKSELCFLLLRLPK